MSTCSGKHPRIWANMERLPFNSLLDNRENIEPSVSTLVMGSRSSDISLMVRKLSAWQRRSYLFCFVLFCFKPF